MPYFIKHFCSCKTRHCKVTKWHIALNFSSKFSHNFIDTLIQWPRRSSSMGAYALFRTLSGPSGNVNLGAFHRIYFLMQYWCSEWSRYLDFVSAVGVQFGSIIETAKHWCIFFCFLLVCWLFSDTTEIYVNIVSNMQSVTLHNLGNQLLNPQLCTVNKQSPAVSLFSLLSVMRG